MLDFGTVAANETHTLFLRLSNRNGVAVSVLAVTSDVDALSIDPPLIALDDASCVPMASSSPAAPSLAAMIATTLGGASTTCAAMSSGGADLERDIKATATCVATSLVPLARNSSTTARAGNARDLGWLGGGCTAYVALHLHASSAGLVGGTVTIRTARDTTQLVVRADVVSGRLDLDGVDSDSTASRTLRMSRDAPVELALRSTFDRNVVVRAVHCTDARLVVARVARLIAPNERRVAARVRLSFERRDAELAEQLAEIDRMLPASALVVVAAPRPSAPSSSSSSSSSASDDGSDGVTSEDNTDDDDDDDDDGQRDERERATRTALHPYINCDDSTESTSSTSASSSSSSAASSQSSDDEVESEPSDEFDARRCVDDWRGAVPNTQQVFVRHAEALRRLAIALGYSATPLNATVAVGAGVSMSGALRARLVVETDIARPIVVNVEVKFVGVCEARFVFARRAHKISSTFCRPCCQSSLC